MEQALFSPMIANVIIILTGAVSLVALVGAAYSYSMLISSRKRLAKADKIEHELKALQHEVQEIKKHMANDGGKEAAASLPADNPAIAVNAPKRKLADRKLSPEVWQKFVDDYNSLAQSMNVPKATEACENFVRAYKLQMLVCVEANSANSTTPVYVVTDKVSDSSYWAWNITGKPEDFAVVPNPSVAYDEKIHHEGGMKETFASNYESGVFQQIQVKLPAHFSQHSGTWKIVQPGVIRLK